MVLTFVLVLLVGIIFASGTNIQSASGILTAQSFRESLGICKTELNNAKVLEWFSKYEEDVPSIMSFGDVSSSISSFLEISESQIEQTNQVDVANSAFSILLKIAEYNQDSYDYFNEGHTRKIIDLVTMIDNMGLIMFNILNAMDLLVVLSRNIHTIFRPEDYESVLNFMNRSLDFSPKEYLEFYSKGLEILKNLSLLFDVNAPLPFRVGHELVSKIIRCFSSHLEFLNNDIGLLEPFLLKIIPILHVILIADLIYDPASRKEYVNFVFTLVSSIPLSSDQKFIGEWLARCFRLLAYTISISDSEVVLPDNFTAIILEALNSDKLVTDAVPIYDGLFTVFIHILKWKKSDELFEKGFFRTLLSRFQNVISNDLPDTLWMDFFTMINLAIEKDLVEEFPVDKIFVVPKNQYHFGENIKLAELFINKGWTVKNQSLFKIFVKSIEVWQTENPYLTGLLKVISQICEDATVKIEDDEFNTIFKAILTAFDETLAEPFQMGFLISRVKDVKNIHILSKFVLLVYQHISHRYVHRMAIDKFIFQVLEKYKLEKYMYTNDILAEKVAFYILRDLVMKKIISIDLNEANLMIHVMKKYQDDNEFVQQGVSMIKINIQLFHFVIQTDKVVQLWLANAVTTKKSSMVSSSVSTTTSSLSSSVSTTSSSLSSQVSTTSSSLSSPTTTIGHESVYILSSTQSSESSTFESSTSTTVIYSTTTANAQLQVEYKAKFEMGKTINQGNGGPSKTQIICLAALLPLAVCILLAGTFHFSRHRSTRAWRMSADSTIKINTKA